MLARRAVGEIEPHDIEPGIETMTELLRQRHRITAEQEDDFSIRNLTEIANTASASANTLSMLLAAVAAVSLLVGGIGIMNIMLVSVTERTREIGLRMAVGARTRDILGQFLVEAVTLTGLGAAVGLLLGILVAVGVRTAFPAIPASTPFSAVAAALLVSAFTGILFGLLPAMRAARLDPVAALRYE